MNRANFYGQALWVCSLMRPSLTLGNYLEKMPSMRDKWEPAVSSFEQKLAQEINQTKLMSDHLSMKMADAQSYGLSDELKKEITQNLKAIAMARKMMALIVEHTKKGMDAIAANFR